MLMIRVRPRPWRSEVDLNADLAQEGGRPAQPAREPRALSGQVLTLAMRSSAASLKAA